ncbi:hypothetical protein BSZ35_19110 [Salinibacter sp. 10B]|uniref:hypothetical protein n=1 Tax=Salinibacter sp. 10B TaxID=1923971 RepID=UPI000CF3818D|nr:hypothetical protein [Salinibacter sp. 10B]PQJ26759.1 hypothetical protein BSZ35_19110 [Salinibacter sp. 10B]
MSTQQPTLQTRFIDECPHEIGRRLARRMIPTQLRDVRRPEVHEMYARILHGEADVQHEPTEAERRGVDLEACDSVALIWTRLLQLLPTEQTAELYDVFLELERLAAGEDALPGPGEPASEYGVPVETIEDRRRWLRLFSYVRALLCTGCRLHEREAAQGKPRRN